MACEAQAAAVEGGVEEAGEVPGADDVDEADEMEEDGPDVAGGVVLDVVPSTVVGAASAVVATGPATFNGGGSLTWASAALTICQVKVVANAATRTQAPAMLHLLTPQLSPQQEIRPLKQTSRFPQVGKPSPGHG